MSMKSVILTATFIALGTGVAAAFGPSPSDANPPGALSYSKPDSSLNSAPVGLQTQPQSGPRRAR
jgi:hypothetical protein